jgi:hypothetical protein
MTLKKNQTNYDIFLEDLLDIDFFGFTPSSPPRKRLLPRKIINNTKKYKNFIKN